MTAFPSSESPKIALFSSGDELLTPGIPPQPGKIFDANSYSLGLLARREGAEVIRLGVARDEYQAVLERFEMAKNAGADLILTSAGVSVGAFDFVRQVLEEHGQVKLWRVNMRPGKPLTFGSYEGYSGYQSAGKSGLCLRGIFGIRSTDHCKTFRTATHSTCHRAGHS